MLGRKHAKEMKSLFVVLLVVFCFSSRLCAQCRAPDYRVGKVLASGPSLVLADISIQPGAFTIDKLVCLAAVLKEKYQASEVAVAIFGSHKAAVNYTPPAIEKRPDEDLWASQLHAEYYLNREKHQEYVVLTPDGWNPGAESFDTRIDLPMTTKISCRLQIRDRCLVAFHHIWTFEQGSATVTLTAQIEEDGSVSDVRVAEPDAPPTNDERTLADFAVHNLQSWHFERSKTKDPIKITYSTERVNTPLDHGIDVEFRLPDRVEIRMGPLLLRPQK
jgi:hypothetical protein